MGKKSKFSIQEKEKIVLRFLNNEISTKHIYKCFKVNRYVLNKWVRRYCTHGITGLEDRKKWANYSKELKKHAVLEALNGVPILDILNKYDISADTVLYRWIKLYNSHKELRDSGGKTKIMAYRKNVSIEEKIEAIKHCIENNKNYHKTSEFFNVSYQQIYLWVKKYEEGGAGALEDRRGKHKELSDEDKQKIKIRKLQKEIELLKVENLFLKKLEELKRR
ncbi:transposase [Cetobacterium sp.]|uniref:transposase n=1 Tax=Cetobacterium sp. TaxID=2071632 RepID=UPI003F39D2D6